MKYANLILKILPAAFLTMSSASASIVLTNLNQTVAGTTTDNYIGQAIMTGPSANFLSSVGIMVGTGYTPVTPVLEIEASNSNGTVSSTTLDTISGSSNYSYNSSTGLLTFTPPTSFTLAANTDYWLVFSDSGAPMAMFSADYTASSTYTAQSGFTIPSTDAAFESSVDHSVSGTGSGYYTLASGPEMFQVSATPTPEPSSLFYMIPFAGLALRMRRRRTA